MTLDTWHRICDTSYFYLFFIFVWFDLLVLVLLSAHVKRFTVSRMQNFEQTRCSWGCSTNTFVIHSFIESVTDPYVQISSKYCLFQSVRAKEPNFGENVHPPLHVICHMSCFMCHMSCVTCHFFVWQIGEASWWRVCYKRGLPRLVIMRSIAHPQLPIVL